MNKGKFIVFEGIDGAGKSTQIELLASRLRQMGQSVNITAEPTTNESGKALRRALSGKEKKTECEMAAMFVLDRIGHNAEIREQIDEGITVISDRYYYSNLAYQGKSTDYAWVRTMNIDCPEIRRPDVCIYLDLTPEESLKRISRGRESVEIYENLEKLTDVRDTFHSVIKDLSSVGEKIFIVDAAASIEEISDKIFEIVTNI